MSRQSEIIARLQAAFGTSALSASKSASVLAQAAQCVHLPCAGLHEKEQKQSIAKIVDQWRTPLSNIDFLPGEIRNLIQQENRSPA